MMIDHLAVLARESGTVSPDNLEYLISRYGVTIVQATPATWQLLLNNKWKPPHPLTALCGGESMTPYAKNALLSLPGLSLWNAYGPTETTVWCSVKKMVPESEICIGPPVANAGFYVLNDDLAEVEIGEIGELHIRGEGVSLGYLNQPQLTGEKLDCFPAAPPPYGLQGQNGIPIHGGKRRRHYLRNHSEGYRCPSGKSRARDG